MNLQNELNQKCHIHKKECAFFCQYTKCINRILCEKCVRQHAASHPKQFIYPVQNLAQLHSYNKMDKLRQILVGDKMVQEDKIKGLYSKFDNLCDELKQRIFKFKDESRQMTRKELQKYLAKNKFIIETIKVEKSNTGAIEENPRQMLAETLAEVETVNKKQGTLTENAQAYHWYYSAAQQLCQSLLKQLRTMFDVSMKVIENYKVVQENRFEKSDELKMNHHQDSFHKRYYNSHYVASHKVQNELEMQIILNRKEMLMREKENKTAQNEINQKMKKIHEYQTKIQILRSQLIQWEQKAEKEEKERKEALQRERKAKEEQLIRAGIIGENRKTINMDKKEVQEKLFPLIFQLIPEPDVLDLSYHRCSRQQLKAFCECKTLLELRMNFVTYDQEFLMEAFPNFSKLVSLQLNSAEITDQIISRIAHHFPPKIRRIQLMDNKITDEGLQVLFKKMGHSLESLHISYNPLTPRSVEIISKNSPDLRVLHITKSPIKSKGAVMIGSYLKNVQELFIGGSGTQRQGLLAILRGCKRLKKLSLVSTQLTSEILFQFVSIQSLEWLDISYCLSKADKYKIEKIKMLNKKLQIMY